MHHVICLLDFPKELLGAIIHCLGEELSSLAALAVTCKPLLPLCRQHLYRTVTLNHGHDVLVDVLSHHGIASAVRRLHVLTVAPLDQLLIRRTSLHNLRELNLQSSSGKRPPNWNDLSPVMQTRLITLMNQLTLKSVSFTARTSAKILHHCRRVTNLRLYVDRGLSRRTIKENLQYVFKHPFRLVMSNNIYGIDRTRNTGQIRGLRCGHSC